MASVTAVIPNFNRRDLLVALLRDLSQQSHPATTILVVDNGSEDDSVNVATQFGASVLELERNAGFSVAVNRGIEKSEGEYVAILNNDVELDRDWLKHLVNELESGCDWFATGKIYQWGKENLIDGTHDELARSGCAWRCGAGREDGAIWDEPRTIHSAPFTALLLRRSLFDEIGPLDERFESYLEDVDFGIRCAVTGHAGRYVPQAVAHHRGSATLGAWHPKKTRLMARNQVMLVAKHFPARWWFRFGWPVLVGQLLWGLVALRHGAGRAFVMGKWEGWKQFRRVRSQRRDSGDVGVLLRESEETIRELQRRTGSDWYWRLYFALT